MLLFQRYPYLGFDNTQLEVRTLIDTLISPLFTNLLKVAEQYDFQFGSLSVKPADICSSSSELTFDWLPKINQGSIPCKSEHLTFLYDMNPIFCEFGSQGHIKICNSFKSLKV